MEDSDIYKHIERLVNEEHEILELSAQGGLDDEQRKRMQQIEKYLDQCWDLLRQRRAKRAAGLEPGDARLNDPAIAEYFPQGTVSEDASGECAEKHGGAMFSELRAVQSGLYRTTFLSKREELIVYELMIDDFTKEYRGMAVLQKIIEERNGHDVPLMKVQRYSR